MNTQEFVDFAASSLATGKPRTYGILNHPQKGLLFLGRGIQRPIINLWVRLNDEFWDLKSFSFQIVLQKGKEGAPAWFVIMDKNWNYIASSREESSDFCCIAIMGRQEGPAYNEETHTHYDVPLCFKMRTTPKFSTAALVQDGSIYELWMMEGIEMYTSVVVSSELEQSEVGYNESHDLGQNRDSFKGSAAQG